MAVEQNLKTDYDFVIIGSGFGGSVAALRLSEKGYKVLVLEKGKRLGQEDFPKTNWNLKRWLWFPALRFFGLFKLTFFRHVTVLSGTGVGGGSLVYAATLAAPQPDFFRAPGWSGLADWEPELKPHYAAARSMLGAARCPRLETGDRALRTLAEEIGRPAGFAPVDAGVFFGEPDVPVPDPYFKGKGPARTGCTFCGGCMIGCRKNAKNSLDKNYLYLAEQLGAGIRAGAEVIDVAPLGGSDGSGGYRVAWKSPAFPSLRKGSHTCRGVVFAGGVLGTVPLLLKLKQSSLPRLSAMIGTRVRTNSESLVGVVSLDRDAQFSDGLAINSILQTDGQSHLEPVRYPAGSGFWRLMIVPMVHGKSALTRTAKVLFDLLRHPLRNAKVYFVDDHAKRSQILLYMRTIDSTLRLSRGLFGMKTSAEEGPRPTPFMEEARMLASRFAAIVNGKPMALMTETFLGIPTTAHILGGAVMGKDEHDGVIDRDNRVFGYCNLYICDGSMISANPGVNPSLTITALAERAMSKIPPSAGAHSIKHLTTDEHG